MTEQLAHDELADLFLGATLPTDRRAETAPEEQKLRVEYVLTPRLGSREAAFVRRYGAALAEEAGRPVLVFFVGALTASAEVVAGPSGDVGEPRRVRTLHALLRGAEEQYAAVLIHGGGDPRTLEPGAKADAVTVLFKPTMDSTAWAYRSLGRVRREAGDGPVLRAGTVGPARAPGEVSPVAELQRVASAELGERVELASTIERVSHRLVFRAMSEVSIDELIGRVRDEPEPSAEPERVEPTGDVGELTGLVDQLRDLTDLGIRCPDAPRVLIGLDLDGRVQLVAEGIEQLPELLAAEAWCAANAELLEKLDAVRDAEEPGVHLTTRDAREVTQLARTYVRLHLEVDGGYEPLN
ncbi:MAG: hypothetical protein AAGI17_10540 [Planctomycetota bacterium]